MLWGAVYPAHTCGLCSAGERGCNPSLGTGDFDATKCVPQGTSSHEDRLLRLGPKVKNTYIYILYFMHVQYPTAFG